ncbi:MULTISPECIES: ROK family transcriptional regulator [unclassified Agrobacterium]|uniref:ROK family transcriptional regulator n=1 Tax=unclassified Agrobacterium TaxID=2632611 RepID=UPI00069A8645|nr:MULTISPECIES: ROK family transcriptional regulator [unclassified Agrobacterium]KNY33271.1 NagC family transcriptional regulator [Agrobacterium sp. SUL3]MCD4662423.1 ROK family transcriptional regulator [Agrobacterium sp.]
MTERRNGGLTGIGTTQGALLGYIRRKGSASRVELADHCNITPAAVSMMTRNLLERGIIVEGARRQEGRGAPHIDLLLKKNVGYALGVHANCYLVMLTLLNFGGEIVGELRLRGSYRAFSDVQKALQEGSEELLAKNAIDRKDLIGAVIAMPTRFHREAASLDLAEEVISWADSDLSAMLREALPCQVIIENDANAAAMGELTLGNTAGHENFAYIYLSEGIGGGVIIKNELYRGYLGNAGEIGALRNRNVSRPSFEDLAAWCLKHVGEKPAGRAPDVWTDYLSRNPAVLDAWLERAGPEVASLGFAVSAVLAPTAIYVGGTLPRIVREKLVDWLDFKRSDPFNGSKVIQPQILLPEVIATDPVAFGAAAMILHGVSETG